MQVENILPEDLPIWQVYQGKCVLCRDKAVTLHEEPPKSLNPKWKQMPETRYALCNHCHMEVHNMSRKDAQSLLESYRGRDTKQVLLELKTSMSGG